MVRRGATAGGATKGTFRSDEVRRGPHKDPTRYDDGGGSVFVEKLMLYYFFQVFFRIFYFASVNLACDDGRDDLSMKKIETEVATTYITC